MPTVPPFSSTGLSVITDWMAAQGRTPFAFQVETWEAISRGESGLVNAPTGCGKTFSVFLGTLIAFIDAHPTDYQQRKKNGLQLLWVTPLRALAADIARAMEAALLELNIPWQVGIRNGDTKTSEREKQKNQMPEILLITPESWHLLLASSQHLCWFESLRVIAIDEWHELLGSKRGIQVELAIAHLIAHRKPTAPTLVWGISATIGNLEEAADVLLAPVTGERKMIRAQLDKSIQVISIYPDEIERYPWAGHLGLRLAEKLLPLFERHKTTLLFINTRGMSERWYQALLDQAPELAGAIALHHGSIEQALRTWVEEQLHVGKLQVVVCTASLDLGVDFRPVEAVIQVGSPKGVSRFLQRAGRSGHQPGATSTIYFLPTHALELMEVAALKGAIAEGLVESREPLMRCFDVLLQFCCTLAVGDGFEPEATFTAIQKTHAYADISREEWHDVLLFLTQGGRSLQAYEDFHKLDFDGTKYRIANRRAAMRHRLSIGTIVSDALLRVKLQPGGFIGTIEEWFISRLSPGDAFTIAGRTVELVRMDQMTVHVRASKSKQAIVPSWMGGRMPLSANLGRKLRDTLYQVADRQKSIEPPPGYPEELEMLQPLFELQNKLSVIPGKGELLIEQIETKQGHHLFVYPFEGRLVHEALAAILAWRISQRVPITFSIAMNDYGFELLSDQPIPVDDSNVYELFSAQDLFADINRSVNATEMAKRKFRDIAVIGGLIITGKPGERVKARHLQSNSSLLFQVFQEYDPNHLLLRQAYTEVLEQQMEEARLRATLDRISQGNILLEFPTQVTPLCFPIIADGLNRNNLSSEQLEDRIRKMQDQLTA